MTADEFIDELEKRSLIPADVLANLREQVRKSLKIVDADSIAKLLVSKKRLTAVQAQQILAPPPPAAAAAVAAEEEDFGLAPLDDELMLAPLDSEPKKQPAAKQASPAAQAAASASAKAATKPTGAAAKATTAKVTAAKAPPAKPTGAATAKKPASTASSSPLDDLFSGAISEEALGGGQGAGPLLTQRRRSKTPWIVWIGAAAGVALLAGIIALVILTRSNGDPEWKLAEKDYTSSADQDAIYKLDAFLERFPHHAQAGLAKVYRGMAELRMAAAAKTDWDPTLSVAQRVLPRIATQPEFGKVRDQLGKILPDMAEALVKRARDAPKSSVEERRRLTQRAAEAVAVLEDWRYMLDTARPWKQLRTLDDEVAAMTRNLNRDAERDAASTEIRAAIAAGELTKATAALDAICEKYPDLLADGTAAALGEDLVQASAKLVKVSSELHKADTKPRPSPILATVTYAARANANEDSASSSGSNKVDTAEKSPSSGPTVIAVVDRGAAYFVSTADGKLLGRQFIGVDSVTPVAVDPTGRDFILFDAVHRDLCRVTADGAALKWRQPLDDRIDSPPLVMNKQLFAATRSGRLLEIDVETGDIVRTAQFPLPLRAAPLASADGAQLYLPADRDALFIIATKNLSVTSAIYLGHHSSAITLSPVLIGRYVVLVDAGGIDHSVLRVIGPVGTGATPRQVQPAPIPGRISTPLLVIGQRLVAAFDGGGVDLLELTKQGNPPLKDLGWFKEASDFHLPTFVSAADDGFWLAGATFRHFTLTAASELPQSDSALGFGQGTSFAPIQVGEKSIFSMNNAAAPGIWVASGALKASGKTEWRLALGAPIAGGPALVDTHRKLSFVHSLAGVFHVSAQPPATSKAENGSFLKFGSEASTHEIVVAVQAWKNAAETQDAVAKVVDGVGHIQVGPRLWTARKDDGLAPDSWSQSVVPPAVVVGKSLLLATESGQLHLVSHDPEQDVVFQLRTEAGAAFQWLRPGVVPDKSEFIIADGPARLIRLGIKPGDSPRLDALAESPLGTPLVSEIAVNGGQALAVDAGQQLVAFDLADLKSTKNWPLGAPVAWGPVTTGKQTLVATDQEMLCVDDKLELVWRKPLAAGPPVGSVGTDDKDLLFASATGHIWRVDSASGEERAKLDLDQPLSSGPLVVDKTIIVAGADGCLHYVKMP